MFLEIDLSSIGRQDFNFFCRFDKAGKIEKSISKKDLLLFLKILSSDYLPFEKKISFEGDILLNGLSFKKEKIVRKYIQKHSLFLTETFFYSNLTVYQNIKLFSRIWGVNYLSQMALSAFYLEKVSDVLVKDLDFQQKLMLNLTKLIACPSYMWFIDKSLLSQLNEENTNIINNILDIRLKQNAICLIFDTF